MFNVFTGSSCYAHWWEWNVLYSMGIVCFYGTTESFRADAKKRLGIIQCTCIYIVSETSFQESNYLLSVVNTLYSHRAQYISFPPISVTGTSCKRIEYHLHIIIKIPSHVNLESSYGSSPLVSQSILCIPVNSTVWPPPPVTWRNLQTTEEEGSELGVGSIVSTLCPEPSCP